MQLHSIPDIGMGESWRNPVTSLVYRNGELSYTFRRSKMEVTSGRKGKWEFDDENKIILGKPIAIGWNHISIDHVFDVFGNSGSIVIDFNGARQEVRNIGLGYNDRSGPFFKFGIYAPGKPNLNKILIMFDDVNIIETPIIPARQ